MYQKIFRKIPSLFIRMVVSKMIFKCEKRETNQFKNNEYIKSVFILILDFLAIYTSFF